ncbi:hypothetical protein ACTFIY_004876 [Dictyostelium cf. discoideum]
MKTLSLLFIVISLISLINADVFSNTVDFGLVSKSKFVSQTFSNIALPASSFNLEGVQVVILNKTSNQAFNHNFLSSCTIDFTSSGRKIVSFTASNIENQLVFPSPYLVQISNNLNLTVSIYALNVEPQDISIAYYMKWEENSGSKTIVKLTRTASSVVSNFSTFSVPQGSGSGFVIQNSIPWISNAEAMDFQASVSPGIISLSFVEQMNGQNTVICKSLPVYNDRFLVKMSSCDNVVSLFKGATYVTQAVYNNTVPLKNVIANFGFYVGYPTPTTTTTTTSATTGGGSTSHATTSATTGGGSGSTSHATTSATTGGGSSSSPSTTHASTTGGGHTTSPSTSSSSHATSGHHGSHSQSESGSHSQSESGSQSQSQSQSESGSQSQSDSFTTTTAGSQSDSFPDSSDGPSYTSGSSGSSGTYIWNGKGVKIDIF